MTDNANRNSFGILEALAAALFILLQVVGRLFPYNDYASSKGVESFVFLVRTLLLSASYIGAPIGYMLIGAKVLGERYETVDDLKRYYRKVLLPAVLATEAWIAINYVLWAVTGQSDGFSISHLAKQLLFLEKPDNMGYIWYLHANLAMLLVAPFLSIAVTRFTFRSLMIPFGFALITAMVLPFISQVGLCYLGKIDSYTSLIPLTASGGYVAIYYMLGYYFGREKYLCAFPVFLLSIMFLLGFVPNVLLQVNAIPRGVYFPQWFTSPLLLLYTLPVYELFRRAKENRYLSALGRISIGALLTHNIFMKLLDAPLRQIPFTARAIVLLFLTLLLSFGASYLISKAGKVGKILTLRSSL